jgi:hypothetical protein
MIRFATLAAALLLAIPAQAATFAPDDNGLITFQLPSGNIGCTYVPEGGTPVYTPPGGHAELQCDRVEPSYVRVFMGTSGAAKKYSNVGDASCCGYPNVLDYGESWHAGPFTCSSATTGLTCTRGSHGLKMSRKRIRVW